MNALEAILLGLVEGITEYLPISSTGHLILAGALLGLDDPDRKAAVDAFDIVVQGGAILAVVGLYAERVAQMARGAVGRDGRGLKLLVNVLVAFAPAAVLGVLLDDLIEAWLFHSGPVLLALGLGGVWMIVLDQRKVPATLDLDGLDWRKALVIGLLQCVAMWPGTSRSMMTIAGGTLVGLPRREAAEFSFLLGLPTLGSACLYKLAKNLLEAHDTGGPHLFDTLGYGPVLLGVAVATVSAAAAVRWLVGFLTTNGLAPFGWYRLALALVMAALVALGLVDVG